MGNKTIILCDFILLIMDDLKITIRLAKSEDCEDMMGLIKELAIYEKAENEVIVDVSTFEKCGFGENKIWTAYVAFANNEMVGLSLFYPRYSTWKGPKLYLEDIVVKEAFRGNKIGKMLMDKTIEYAQEHGYVSLFWQVLDWNKPAINFYKKYKTKFDDEWLNVSIDF